MWSTVHHKVLTSGQHGSPFSPGTGGLNISFFLNIKVTVATPILGGENTLFLITQAFGMR